MVHGNVPPARSETESHVAPEVASSTAAANPSTSPPSEDIDSTLARALDRAAEAGRFDVVAVLAAELQARRLTREGVVALDAKRRERGA